MANERPVGELSRLSAESLGVFRARDAVRLGVSRKQLMSLAASGLVELELPGVYRMTAVGRCAEQRLRAALMWAGDAAIAGGRSAGTLYNLEGVHAPKPEIVVPSTCRVRSPRVVVHRSDDRAALMIRTHRGLHVTGVEPTLISLAAVLDGETFEIACEDARRRRLTGIPALREYLRRFGRRGRSGVATTRALIDELDPVHESRSTLEVKTRRLLVANGITQFRRELPLEWNGRIYRFDFGFAHRRTILETNGRRWHDDARDFERDNEKWSVPGRYGYRLVFATWTKVTKQPRQLLHELTATLAA